MILKTVLIIFIIILGLVVILPFFLNLAGVKSFQFGAIGGLGGAAGEGILRSLDSGKNWENAAVSEEKRISFPSAILDMAFHPKNSDTIFVGAKSSGLWRSDNGGKSWHKILDKAHVLDPRADVYKIGLSPANLKVMYLAVFQNGRGRVLRSEDGGETFREIYFVTANRFGVFDLFVSKSDTNYITIVTGQGGVLNSQNGGRTWRVKKWFSEALIKFLVNPNFAGELFVLTSSGNLFKSFDGGGNWADLNEGLRGRAAGLQYPPPGAINPFGGLSTINTIQSLVADPNNFSTLYMGSLQGILRSADGGFSWERLNVLIPPEALPVNSVAIDPRNSNIIFAAASNQLHRSDDNGRNWSIQTLPTKSRVKELLIHPLKPEIMFALLGK